MNPEHEAQSTKLRVLLIEDNHVEAALIKMMLDRAEDTSFEVEHTLKLSAGLERLAAGGIDMILLDLSLPDSDGFETFARVHAQAPRVPIVIMTGLDDEKVAVQAVRKGAQDYLVKGAVDFQLLLRSMRYSIERNLAEEALRKAHGELEVRVQERTAELAQANKALRFEIAERKRAEEALQEAHDLLEKRVFERTTALAKANRSLQAEIAERKGAQEQLLNYQGQLQSLASELSLAEERERRRVATALHDNIGQSLALSKIKLGTLGEMASSTDITEPLEEIRKLIEETIQSTRSLTSELSPPVLYELGFEAAVEWLGEQFQKQHGILFSTEMDDQQKPLKDDIRILLFSAVRELLINVAKHAQASRTKISIWRNCDTIRVKVEDDGIGFNGFKNGSSVSRNGGFGLFSIRERLNHLGGHLEIESEPDRGTRVTLAAPLKY